MDGGNVNTRRLVVFVPESKVATIEAGFNSRQIVGPNGQTVTTRDYLPAGTLRVGIWRTSDGLKVGRIFNWAMDEATFQWLKTHLDVTILKNAGLRFAVMEDVDPTKCADVLSKLPAGYTFRDPAWTIG